jgi:Flp pilus assembly protein TadG
MLIRLLLSPALGLRGPAPQRRGGTLSEHGSALIETALSLSLLFALVFGIMEIGWALYTYHFISEAAREGTRYAMVRGSSCAAAGSLCTDVSQTDIQNYVKNLGFPGINSSDMTVTAAWPSTGAACTPSTTPCNNPGNLVQVTVAYQFPLSIPFVGASTINMSSLSEMVISQ